MSRRKKHKVRNLDTSNRGGASEADASEIWHHLDTYGIPEKDSDEPVEETQKKARFHEFVIDLHGYTLAEAIALVDQKIGLWSKSCFEIRLKIITGKGRHSEDGRGVLVDEVYRHVASKYQSLLHKIDSPPREATIDGLPLRGHFCVTLRPT